MQLVAKAWAKYYKTSSYITPMLALHAKKLSRTQHYQTFQRCETAPLWKLGNLIGFIGPVTVSTTLIRRVLSRVPMPC